jgi:hypothetical protein
MAEVPETQEQFPVKAGMTIKKFVQSFPSRHTTTGIQE